MRVTFAITVLLASSAQAGAPPRYLLRADADFFVGRGGSDSRDCRTNRTACATLQHVVDVIYRNFDAGCRKISIHVLEGSTLKGAILQGQLAGQCATDDLLIVGSDTHLTASAENLNPYNRTITGPLSAMGGARFRVEGLRLTSQEGPELSADDGGSRINAGYIDFGPAGTYHAVAGVHARLRMTNDYTISGGGDGHANAPVGQFQILPGVAVTFVTSETAPPHWKVAFVATLEGGLVNITYGDPDQVPAKRRVRFLNALGQECGQGVVCATGQRWAATFHSQIVTLGGHQHPYWLPGDQPPEKQGTNGSADSTYN